jgi:hypothetical protein
MQQYSQVIPVDTEVPADLVFVAFLKKDLAQNPSVALTKVIQNLPDHFDSFLAHYPAQHIGLLIGNVCGFGVILDCTARRSTIMLEQHVVTYGIDKGTQAVSLPQAIRTSQRSYHSDENLLPDVLDCLWGTQPRTQLQPDQLTKIPDKMVFSPEVSRTKPRKIGLVE